MKSKACRRFWTSSAKCSSSRTGPPAILTYTGDVWATAPLLAVTRAAIHSLDPARNTVSNSSSPGFDLLAVFEAATLPLAMISMVLGVPISGGAQARALTCSLEFRSRSRSSPGGGTLAGEKLFPEPRGSKHLLGLRRGRGHEGLYEPVLVPGFNPGQGHPSAAL
jgi:hypothetical protein